MQITKQRRSIRLKHAKIVFFPFSIGELAPPSGSYHRPGKYRRSLNLNDHLRPSNENAQLLCDTKKSGIMI